MQPPTRIEPARLADYLEVMTKAAFQAGISWNVIEAKWPGFLDAFAGFDPETVAAFTPADVERLMGDARIVRNRRKIEATIHNAGEMLVLAREHGDFRAWLRGHASFAATVADLRKDFRFLGETGAYFFLYSVGEEVPPHEEWVAAHPSVEKAHEREQRAGKRWG